MCFFPHITTMYEAYLRYQVAAIILYYNIKPTSKGHSVEYQLLYQAGYQLSGGPTTRFDTRPHSRFSVGLIYLLFPVVIL